MCFVGGVSDIMAGLSKAALYRSSAPSYFAFRRVAFIDFRCVLCALTMAVMSPGKRPSTSAQRDVLCISTPLRLLRMSPASRSALKCCESVDFGTSRSLTVRKVEQVCALSDHEHAAGKVAVVTGASKGSARHRQALAAEGASVVVNYVEQGRRGHGRRRHRPRGRKAIAVGGDVSSKEVAQEIIDAAIKRSAVSTSWSTTPACTGFASIEAVNEATSTVIFGHQRAGPPAHTQAAAKHLTEGGSIINVSSAVTQPDAAQQRRVHRHEGRGRCHHGRAREGARPRKIRVNSINPGMVETGRHRQRGIHRLGLREGDRSRRSPLGRTGQPGDIADVAVFLASNDSRWLTGERLVASGGIH